MSAIVETVVSSYHRTHRLVLKTVADLTNDQLRSQPNLTTPPIAFHLWHLARYADSLPDQIGVEGGMLWHTEKLAEKWGFSPETLGIYESGTGMETAIPGHLRWPGKEELLAYVSQAFEIADEVVGLLDQARFQQAAKWGGRTVGRALMMNLEHDNRHLGMIECMSGVLGLRGSATE